MQGPERTADYIQQARGELPRLKGKLRGIRFTLYSDWHQEPKYMVAEVEIDAREGMGMNAHMSWYAEAYKALNSDYLRSASENGGWMINRLHVEQRPRRTQEPHKIWMFLSQRRSPELRATLEICFYHDDYAKLWYQKKIAEAKAAHPWEK